MTFKNVLEGNIQRRCHKKTVDNFIEWTDVNVLQKLDWLRLKLNNTIYM